MLDGIKKYFKSCPLLKGGAINIDSLGDNPGGSVKYSIETGVCTPLIKKYADGGSQRQYMFLFCSREPLDSHGMQNLENFEFYNKLCDWIENQNKNKIFPELDTGKSCQRVEALTDGYLMDETGTSGKYQIQIRVIYYKEG